MLTELERELAASAAKHFPKGNGDLFIANRAATWNVSRTVRILEVDSQAVYAGCPAVIVAVQRGDPTKIGLLRALDDVCQEIRLTREDYCDLLDRNPRKVSSLLGYRLVKRNGKAGK